MDHSTSAAENQVVTTKLRHLIPIVAELEAAGVRVISAEASRSSGISVLLSVHQAADMAAFLNWLKKAGAEAALTECPDDKTDLSWAFTVQYAGAALQGYISDPEKAAWDEMEAG